MDQITHEVRLAHWTKVVEECASRPKEQTARQWLAENNIPEKSYYYWLRRIRANAYEEVKNTLPAVPKQESVVLAEIPVSTFEKTTVEKESFAPAVILKADGFSIEFSNDASKSLISKIMEGIRHAR